MKIRSQIIAALVPLFVGLALVTGGVTYYLQTKEMEWGLYEEASSIAVVVARFLDGETVRQISTDDSHSHSSKENTFNLFRKITSAGRASRLTIFTAPDWKQILDVTASNSFCRSIQFAPSVTVQLGNRPFVTGSIEKGSNGSSHLTTYASIRSKNGELSGILAVETAADFLQLHRGALIDFLLISITSSALLGLLLAMVISALITRKLANITKAVSSVEAGFYDHKPDAGIIDELNDLENTFDTMRSVLKEAVSKIWRTIIEAEQFRTKEELICAFKNEFQPPVHEIIYGVEISGTLFGCKTKGAFFEVRTAQEYGYAIAGQVESADYMKQAETVSAVLAFIGQTSKIEDIPSNLKTVTCLFNLINCKFVIWNPSSSKATTWLLDADSGQWHENTTMLNAKTTLILHTMNSTMDSRIQTYAHEFESLPQETLMKEICMLVDEKLDGAILLLRSCPPP